MIFECIDCNAGWSDDAVHCPYCHTTYVNQDAHDLHQRISGEYLDCYRPAMLGYMYERDITTREPLWYPTLTREEIEQMTEPTNVPDATADMGSADEGTVTGSFYPSSSEATEEPFHVVPAGDAELKDGQVAADAATATAAPAAPATTDAKAARAWAVANGWPQLEGKRGRLPADALAAYAASK